MSQGEKFEKNGGRGSSVLLGLSPFDLSENINALATAPWNWPFPIVDFPRGGV